MKQTRDLVDPLGQSSSTPSAWKENETAAAISVGCEIAIPLFNTAALSLYPMEKQPSLGLFHKRSASKMPMHLRLDPFLEAADAERVSNVLQKLDACGLDYAVTGGMALEPALGSGLGRQRAFNDIDVVVSGFDALPPALASVFMISHAHPHRPLGKLAIQLVEPNQRVRVDVFSACGDTLERTRPALIGNLPIKVVAVEDLACRIASEMMCFSRGDTVLHKCADDHARAIQVVDMKLVEKAWRDQRREIDPLTYTEASVQIVEALKRDTGKLVKPTYSTDTDAVCRHCYNTANFMVASPKSTLPILGYC